MSDGLDLVEEQPQQSVDITLVPHGTFTDRQGNTLEQKELQSAQITVSMHDAAISSVLKSFMEEERGSEEEPRFEVNVHPVALHHIGRWFKLCKGTDVQAPPRPLRSRNLAVLYRRDPQPVYFVWELAKDRFAFLHTIFGANFLGIQGFWGLLVAQAAALVKDEPVEHVVDILAGERESSQTEEDLERFKREFKRTQDDLQERARNLSKLRALRLSEGKDGQQKDGEKPSGTVESSSSGAQDAGISSTEVNESAPKSEK